MKNLTLILVLVILVFGVVAIVSPRTAEKAEAEAVVATQEIVRDVYKAEQRVEDWFNNQQQIPPVPVEEDRQLSVDASEAMKKQPSSWVDGEKKLKEKLKALVERQQQGKDLGVPILTRYLGEDFPAWVPEDGDKEDWTKKRDERYAEMKKEEEQWRERVKKYMETQDHHT